MKVSFLKGRFRRAGALMLAAGGLAVVASVMVGGTASAASKSPFVYVMVTDQTGPYSIYGKQDYTAMEAAAAYFNTKGGIGGHHIVLTDLNDNGDEAVGETALVTYLSSHPKPNAIFPGTSGGDSAGAYAETIRAGVLGMGVDSDGGLITGNCTTACPTVFIPGDATAVDSATEAIWFKQRGYKKVGILQEDEAFSQSETPPLEAALTKEGVPYTLQSFSPTATDVRPEISALQSAGANVIMAESLGSAPGIVAQGRAQLGIAGTMPVLWDIASASADITKLAPPADLGNSWEEVPFAANPKAKAPGRTLLTKYLNKYGGYTDAIIVASFEWQDMVELYDAAKQAGSISQGALIKALEHPSKATINDPLNLTAHKIQFSVSQHNSLAGQPSDYAIVRTGPITSGGTIGAAVH